ncbi:MULTISPECIES: serine hydrolase domain-containing protein [unclassified Variovorax]|uniref:serine hydrolase domain-containing protein n=1 Tax=unclassified Variovorax TaxID=663243 RepID=UPI003F45072D
MQETTTTTPAISRRGLLRLSLGGTAMASLPGIGWAATGAAVPAFTDGLPRSRPEAQGISSASILAFLDDAERGAFELHSFMLWRNGHVVAEGWWDPYKPERRHMTHSLTKSVTVCAVGMAIADGKFGLDDKVVSFFPEHLPPTVSANLAAMTVRDLLTMRTGHESMVSGSVWRPIRTSWIAEFFKIPVVYTPGSKFVYTSAATYMLSAIVTKTTGQSTADYLKPRFFDPLGITGYEWDVGPEGISPGANGLSWKTVDSLKLGILHAQNGQWNGKQILTKAWVDSVHAPHTKDRYGYQWWLGQHGAYNADGLFGQYSVVFPEQNAVLALNSALPPKAGFNAGILYKHFPAAFGATALTSEKDYAALKARTRTLQLLPPVKPTSSPVAANVSGQRFDFAENPEKIKSMRLDFSSAESCVFTMEDDRGTHKVQVGLRKPFEGDTTITGNKLHHEYQPEVMRVVASGEWRDARTFVMTWTFVESAFRDTVECRFSGPYMRFDRSVNVNSSATEMPTLTGTRAKT